jgi:hypothetical protein
MTREQDFERQLAEWLEAGPVTAPSEVVDRAIARTAGRRQRRRAWAWLSRPEVLLRQTGVTGRPMRMATFAVLLVGLLLTSLLLAVPLGGGAGPTPEMDPSAVRAIAGTAHVIDRSEAAGSLLRVIDVEVEDQRIDGQATQTLQVLLETPTGMHRSRGTMRLVNDWGAWEGPLDVVAYPSGEEYELASLEGTGAYAGYTYLHSVRHQPDEADRTVEGAIWPDEPPSMPDPSLLP